MPAPVREPSRARFAGPTTRRPASRGGGGGGGAPKPEPTILFQTYFKSVGPRTYAAQVKRAGNGNHFVVLTEGKRDDKTGEVRKTNLFVFSEDFDRFVGLLRETVAFVKANPVPAEVARKRERFWAKHAAGADTPSGKPRVDAPPRPLPGAAASPKQPSSTRRAN